MKQPEISTIDLRNNQFIISQTCINRYTNTKRRQQQNITHKIYTIKRNTHPIYIKLFYKKLRITLYGQVDTNCASEIVESSRLTPN